MAKYVDGFVLPIPKKNIAAYRKVAKMAGKMWKEYGALEYIEGMADYVKPGKWTSFPQSVKLKKDEVVFFSWIVYESKAQRNAIMKKIMKDPRMNGPDMMPFDGKRMIFGGFKPVVTF